MIPAKADPFVGAAFKAAPLGYQDMTGILTTVPPQKVATESAL